MMWIYRYFPVVGGLAMFALAVADGQKLDVSDWLLLWILVTVWNKE